MGFSDFLRARLAPGAKVNFSDFLPRLDVPVEVASLRAHGELTAEGKEALEAPASETGIVQRWRERQDFYRSTAERFEPSDWRIDVMVGSGSGLPQGLPVRRNAWKAGQDFIVQNHYAASFSQMRVMIGMFRARDGALVGVATFGNVKADQAKKYGDVGLDDILELNRFVLLDSVPGNAETWFLSRATELAREVHAARGFGLKVLLSYSDPVPRRDVKGFLTMPGHIGNIYQAYNAVFVGRSSPKVLHLDARGVAPDPRMISKIRSLDGDGEEGGPSAARRFVEDHGAPEKRKRESYAAWVRRSLASDAFRRLPHAGNLTYLWTFGSKSFKKQIETKFPERLPYPKNPRQLYLNLQRKSERAWTRGDAAQISQFAELLLSTWLELTEDERAGLAPPPQDGVACSVPSGSQNARGARTLDQVMQQLVCG
jgi:hypothetical protein